jgi:dihydropyrimidinase
VSVLIKGGRIVTAADDYVADVYVEGEAVTLIGAELDQPADKVIDATGKYVLPGMVDPHTHLDMPFGGTVTIDDVESGQTAAAFGGTTTHVDFVIQPPGATFAEALAEWRAKANGKQVIDMGYHMAVTDLDEGGTLDELASLPDEGVTSYKLFMAYKGALMVDDETLFRTMEVAAQTGALVMVHAENGDVIDVLVKQALAAGNTEPIYHALTRPPEAEGEATNRAIQLARLAGAPLYVVHVTCREAVQPIARARDDGWDVWGETCTQYFFNSLDDIAKPDFEGAKYVYSPPVRDKSNWDVLWNAVRTDVLSAISTDHCAFTWKGQKTLGVDDFSKIPNGAPGLENRLQMIHEFGVRAGRISLNRMVELLATSPAKLFGLYPRKGTIAVGSDADLVVFDPEKRVTISAATHHSKSDYNLFEGTEVTGSPEVVLLRGHVLVENDELVAKPGIGSYVARARFGQELKPERVPA